jgi:hypothetical protein
MPPDAISDPQPAPAAVSAPAESAPAPASAPDSPPTGPSSWEAAFAEDDGASNGDSRSKPSADTAAPSAPASDSSDAQEDEAAPAGAESGERSRQPGSRRGTAAENAALQEQVKQAMADLEAERTRAAEAEQAKAAAAADVENLIGKPGELAQILVKEANQGWLDADEHERKIRLVQGQQLYHPLLERARAQAQAEAQNDVASHESRFNALTANLSAQLRAAKDLDGVDATLLEKADLPAILTHVHKAGAASRDGEIADLKGQLDDARGRAFTSQPRLATGGVSGTGRGDAGYDPTKTPAANLEAAFAETSTRNGSR